MTTEPRGRAFRRQFLPLSRKRLGLEAAQRIFLVQGLRNQWLCEFACTKAAAVFERRSAFSWCKAYAINGFPGLLAPKPPPISGGAAHFLGARPTQSMALPVCLHQSRRRFQAARRIFLVQGLRNQWLCEFACTKAAAGGFGRWGTGYGGGPPARRYFFLDLPFALVRFRNSCLRFPASSLRFLFAVLGFITEKPKKPRGSFLRA